jgi:hypothetical protein
MKGEYYMNNRIYPEYYQTNDDRIGFIGPFLLGGLTGGLVAPYFYGPQNRPPYYYQNNIYGPYPYPYPYYRNN